jgi:hypothetical protein
MKAAFSADTFFPTLDGRGTTEVQSVRRMDAFQLSCSEDINSTITLFANDKAIRNSQLKTSTAALNNTKQQLRGKTDEIFHTTNTHVPLSRNGRTRQEKRAMTEAQRRGRSEISSELFHVIQNCEDDGNG